MKKTMSTNKPMRVAMAVLVATMLSACMVGGTFAKYTSSASGSDTATVAKWEINVSNTNGDNKVDITENPAITFDLFKTVNNTGNTVAEGNVAVATGTDTHLIAPGTAGSFALRIENASEVKAKYSIELTETANTSNVPLQYSVNGTTWKDSIDELEMGALTDVSIDMNAIDTKTVYWRWVFEGTTDSGHAGQTDATDTALGVAAQDTAPQVTITAKVTATQVD